jgi:hypothetical protein
MTILGRGFGAGTGIGPASDQLPKSFHNFHKLTASRLTRGMLADTPEIDTGGLRPELEKRRALSLAAARRPGRPLRGTSFPPAH